MPRTAAVTATFDEHIQASTVDASSFTLTSSTGTAVNGVVSLDGTSNVATFTPDSELALLTNYTATLGTGITDLSGNPLASAYPWSFTTADGSWGTDQQIFAGPGAAQIPELAVGAGGEALALLGYDSTGIAQVGVYDPGTGTWDGGSALHSSGIQRFVQLAVDPQGNGFAVWSQSPSGGSSDGIVWANRYDASTKTWGSGENITSVSGSVQYAIVPHVGVDASGNAIAVWQQGNPYPSVWTNRYDAGTGSWSGATQLGSDGDGARIAVSANGNAIAVWTGTSGPDAKARLYDGATDTWSPTMTVNTDTASGHTVGQVRGGMDAHGNAIVAWQQSDGTVRYEWARRYDASADSWSTPSKKISNNTDDNTNGLWGGWYVQIGLDAHGNAFVTWQQKVAGVLCVYGNRYDAGTDSWGTAARLSDNGTYGIYDSIHESEGPYQMAVDASGNAIVLWNQLDGNYAVERAKRYDATTGSWSAPSVTVNSPADWANNSIYVYSPRIGMDAKGNAIALYARTTDNTLGYSMWVNRFE